MSSSRATHALERAVGRDADADDVLRTAVSVLAAEPGVTWAGIALLENGVLTMGPTAGVPDETRRTRVPILFQGSLVGELAADGDVQSGLLERISMLVAAYALIGWDTGGEPWEA
jgi:putative methionine-R-sulfoxide reductase with GAF domain